MDIDQRIKTCEKIREKYPDEFLLETAVEIAKEEQAMNDQQMTKLKKKFRAITNFTEKNEYYTTLQSRQTGYEMNMKRLQSFLNTPQVRPYEDWVNEFTLPNMQRKGYRAVVRDELQYGRLI